MAANTTWRLLFFLTFLFLLSQPFPLHAIKAAAPLHALSLGSTLSGNDTLVSQNGLFALGFARVGARHSFYLAIWYRSSGPLDGLVWTATTYSAVAVDALLQLDSSGDLLLFVSQSTHDAITWATNTQHKGVSHGALSDTGNFVLFNSHSQPVWQSFQHPTNTLLPGQLFYTNDVLRSWASPTNPFPGRFQLILQEDQNLVVYKDASSRQSPCWASGTYREGGSSGGTVYAELDSKGAFLIHYYDDALSSFQNLVYQSSDYGKARAARRLTLDSDGFLRMYAWHGGKQRWQRVWNTSTSCASPS